MASLNAPVSADSAASLIPLMIARSEADTPARFVMSILVKRALASASAVPAVPEEIWKSLYAADVSTLPESVVLAAVAASLSVTGVAEGLDTTTVLLSLLGVGVAETEAARRKARAESEKCISKEYVFKMDEKVEER